MELTIRISDRAVFLLLIGIGLMSAVGIVVAYGTADPYNTGHTWSEMECTGCITSSNLGAGSVTNADINFNYAGSVSKGGPASVVAWGDITGRPSGLDDGDQGITTTCTWSGWSPTCSGCTYGSCQYGTYAITQLNCQGGIITGIKTQGGCCSSCTQPG